MKLNDQNEKDAKQLAIIYIEDEAFNSAIDTLNLIIARRKVIKENERTDEKDKDCLCCANQIFRHKIIDHSIYVKDFSIYKKVK